VVPRRYKPVKLNAKPVPDALRQEAATCPQCDSRITEVLGRMGLRLLFRCAQCRVRFFRHPKATAGARIV
jgi:DNA-directed RNA polymerase subunit RPC12/RpoP